MPYHVVPTLSPGYVVLDSDWNSYIRDNDSYLLGGRPDLFSVVATGSDYTISGTSFADVDASNLILSPTLSGSRYLVEAMLTCAPAASHYLYFDWILDSTTRAGGTLGVMGAFNGVCVMRIGALFTGLSAAAHTFKLQARIDTATFNGTIYRANLPITLLGLEVG
jgi:hypothetical protein